MSFNQKYQITPRYLPTPSARRRGIPMSPGVRFVVVHDTGNADSTAAQNVSYYSSTPNPAQPASAHIFVDDREILECVPALTGAPEKAWHVLYSTPTDNQMFGHNANDAAIGIEYCFGKRIDADEAYRKFVWVAAYACHVHQLDPAKSVVGHFMLDPHRKTDPVTGLAHSRRTYEQLLRDIKSEHDECLGGAVVAPAPDAFMDGPKSVRTTVRLNIRRGAPSSRAPILQTVPPGAQLVAAGAVLDGEPVNGNPVWYFDANLNYFWSGGTSIQVTNPVR